MEEIMNRQNLRPQIGVAALVLAASIASVPAFAQKNPNDGGSFSEPSGVQPSGVQPKIKTSAAKPASPQVGRNVNDGGTPAEPSVAQPRATAVSNTTSANSAPPRPGRNPNDGGSIQ
jgi:hypothetical protein